MSLWPRRFVISQVFRFKFKFTTDIWFLRNVNDVVYSSKSYGWISLPEMIMRQFIFKWAYTIQENAHRRPKPRFGKGRFYPLSGKCTVLHLIYVIVTFGAGLVSHMERNTIPPFQLASGARHESGAVYLTASEQQQNE